MHSIKIKRARHKMPVPHKGMRRYKKQPQAEGKPGYTKTEDVPAVKEIVLSALISILFLILYMQGTFLKGNFTDMLISGNEVMNSALYERTHLQVHTSSYKFLHYMAKMVSAYAYIEENYEAFVNGEDSDFDANPLLAHMIGYSSKNNNSQVLDDNSIFGESYMEETEEESPEEEEDALAKNKAIIDKLYEKKDYDTLIKNFYIVDSSTKAVKKIFDAEVLLGKNLKIEKSEEPQILIYHTHGASESFIDSKEGDKSESVVGVGAYLAEILEKEYGYSVIHDDTEYDRVNGKIDRNKAYNQSLAGMKKWLEKYPSIEVVIDLHRDGVGNKVVRTTTIEGKKTAQVMFFNGLSRTKKGEIDYLYNENLQANLAFSLQCKIAAMQSYPDFTKPVYLKSYRYNLHLKERSMLIELGNENNTVEEAMNAMPPLAKVLNQVLSE